MKYIILVRHAEASPKDLPIPDKDRPLTMRGKDDLMEMKPYLSRHVVMPASACICLSFHTEHWSGVGGKTGGMEHYEYPGK